MTDDGPQPPPALTGLERLAPAEWRQALDSSPAQIAVTIGPRHLLAYQNRASQAMFGTRALGVALHDAFEIPEALVEPLSRVLLTGRTVEGGPRRVEVRDQLGDDILMRYVLAPLGEPPQGVVITALDVTAEVRAEQALARTRLLADITTRMTAAGDAGEALQALTDVLVPDVADIAAIYVVADPDSDPTKPGGPPLSPDVLTVSPLLTALGPPPPLRRRGPSPWDAAILSGTSTVIPVNAATLPVLVPEPAAASWMRSAAVHSLAVVPLVAAGTFTGATVLAGAGARAPFGEADLPFLQDVTARAAVAIADLRAAHQHRGLALEVHHALAHLTELLGRLDGGANLERFTMDLAAPMERRCAHGLDPDALAPLSRDAAITASGRESPAEPGDLEAGIRGVGGGESLVRTFLGPGRITVAGEVDASNEQVLRSALLAASAAAADGPLVVDVSGLAWIDVSGAKSLLTGTAAYRRDGGIVHLVGVSERVDRVLDLIGVNRTDGIRVEFP